MLIDVIAQPLVHPVVTVSPLASGEAQHPVLPISVKDVDLGVLITSKLPKNIERPATEKEVSVHPPESTEEVKPPPQPEIPAQPISEVDTASPAADCSTLT